MKLINKIEGDVELIDRITTICEPLSQLIDISKRTKIDIDNRTSRY